MTLRETARESMAAELANVERYSHERNYQKLHINRDGSVSWFESINKSDDLIDSAAERFAPIPSVITVGTGSCACNCPFCEEVYDEGSEKLAEEQGRTYERSTKYESYEEAITAAVSEADLTEYEYTLTQAFENILVGYFQDEQKEYQLSGEVETGWCDSEDEALQEYNALVEKHNARYKRESNHYAYLDSIPCAGGCYEELEDGTIRCQWPNPTRNHGVVYLEVR